MDQILRIVYEYFSNCQSISKITISDKMISRNDGNPARPEILGTCEPVKQFAIPGFKPATNYNVAGPVNKIPVINVISILDIGVEYRPSNFVVPALESINQRQYCKHALLVPG